MLVHITQTIALHGIQTQNSWLCSPERETLQQTIVHFKFKKQITNILLETHYNFTSKHIKAPRASVSSKINYTHQVIYGRRKQKKNP